MYPPPILPAPFPGIGVVDRAARAHLHTRAAQCALGRSILAPVHDHHAVRACLNTSHTSDASLLVDHVHTFDQSDGFDRANLGALSTLRAIPDAVVPRNGKMRVDPEQALLGVVFAQD